MGYSRLQTRTKYHFYPRAIHISAQILTCNSRDHATQPLDEQSPANFALRRSRDFDVAVNIGCSTVQFPLLNACLNATRCTHVLYVVLHTRVWMVWFCTRMWMWYGVLCVANYVTYVHIITGHIASTRDNILSIKGGTQTLSGRKAAVISSTHRCIWRADRTPGKRFSHPDTRLTYTDRRLHVLHN